MITPDRIEELKIIADRGNPELGELLDAYELLGEYAEVTDLEPGELKEALEELERLR